MSLEEIINITWVNCVIKILLIILLSLVIYYVIYLILAKMIVKYKDDKMKKSQETSLKMVQKLVKVAIIFIAVILILFQIPGMTNLSWTVLSGAGIVALILGYAAQDVLSNFFSGICIVFTDPFEIGDYVKCTDCDITGWVEDVTLRHTVIRTANNRRVIIPNSKMNAEIIENYNHTDNEVCRFIEFGISYESDIDKAIKIIKDEMSKQYNPNTNGINKNVEWPKVRVINWDSSAITLRGWVWGADNSMTFDEIYELYYKVKKRFDKEGIEIPYPHVKVVK